MEVDPDGSTFHIYHGIIEFNPARQRHSSYKGSITGND